MLTLVFDDADNDIPILLPNGERVRPILFDAQMADQVLDFWLAGQAVMIDELYLHCDAGQCRSPAIAAALQDIATNDDSHLFATKRPCMLVYRTLMERAFDRGLMSPSAR